MAIKLDKIFDSFSANSIFNSKTVLQTNYTPETIPHRDDQIKQIAAILGPTLRGEKPSNLFIYGKTGTGKTLSMQYIQDELLKRAKEQGIPLTIEYLNCKLRKVADTEYRILAELLKKLGFNVPSTGLPTDQIYNKFVEEIDRNKRLVVIVLDEIDQIVKKVDNNFLYNLTRLNAELKNSQISVVGISNDLQFLENIDPRIKSSLSEEEIVFPPYNAFQIIDILEERAEKAFKKEVVAEVVIKKCAAYAAREHGDARRALDLLRIAGEIAEREGSKKVEEAHIDKAKEKIEKDKIIDIISTQPKQFQLVLLSIINLTDKKRDKIYTGDIFDIYQNFCNQTATEILTQRRVGDIIAEFDMLGIINAKVISQGRYGRTREISLLIPPNLMDRTKEIIYSSLGLK